VETGVFEPLGMDRTFFLPQEALTDGNVATGLNTAFLEVEGLGSETIGVKRSGSDPPPSRTLLKLCSSLQNFSNDRRDVHS
jgi:CubicO group peptidase (beta-lactamase class C family)